MLAVEHQELPQRIALGGGHLAVRVVAGQAGELAGARQEAAALAQPPGVVVDLYGPAYNIEGIGFGLDFAIILDPEKAKTPEGKNSFYWGGAFGTWFWIDPTNDLIVVGMMQNTDGSRPDRGSPQVRPLSRKLVYAALVDPKK